MAASFQAARLARFTGGTKDAEAAVILAGALRNRMDDV